MLHQLPADRKIPAENEISWKTARAKSHLVEIQGGHASLGLRRQHAEEFGWDNEFEPQEVFVPGIRDRQLQREESRFSAVHAGRRICRIASLWSDEAWAWKTQENIEHPTFWRRNGNLWMYRTMFGDDAVAAGLAGLRQPRGSHRLREVAWPQACPAKNSSIARPTERRTRSGTRLSLGR